MKRIFVPTKGPADWQHFLADPVKQWRAGYSAHACAWGGGAASQRDVFALVGTDHGLCATAIEAKVDEPFGPTVGEWLVDASPGKHERLAGLLDILAIKTPPPGVRYQLIHRTAAALIEARRFTASCAAMLVHSFSPAASWREDFEAFQALFAPEPSPHGIRLTLNWISAPLPYSL